MSSTEYIKIGGRESLKLAVERAVDILKKGGVILYPTDTLYGLGIDVTNIRAVEKLYAIKGRSNRKPVSLMVGSVKQIKNLLHSIPESVEVVLQKLFPGKITALLKNNLKEKIAIFEYLETVPVKVGFRIPQNPFCSLLSQRMESPISTTSANISGQADITKISDLPGAIKNQLDLIIDAGNAEDVRGSTIIDFTEKPFKLVRKGAISRTDLIKLLPDESFAIV